MYIYIYIYIYVCMNIFTYTYIYTYIYVYLLLPMQHSLIQMTVSGYHKMLYILIWLFFVKLRIKSLSLGREHSNHHFITSNATFIDSNDILWLPVVNPRAPPRVIDRLFIYIYIYICRYVCNSVYISVFIYIHV
jgi:hypothetical protein